MFFEPASRVPIPTTDVLSYIFTDPQYDQNKPVSLLITNTPYFKELISDIHSSMLMLPILPAQSPTPKPARSLAN
jgi:hypothetical protein